jgi:hypothetical protein
MKNSAFNTNGGEREQKFFLLNIPAHKRVRAMLEARELAVGLMRGRLRREHPALSINMINIKLIEELSRAR